jgi:hypothetical protein
MICSVIPKPHRENRPYRTAIAALLTASIPSVTSAADRTWIGGTGDWNTSANWSPFGVPGASDNAFVITGGSFEGTINYDYAGAAVTLTSLRVDHPNTFGGAFTVLSMPGALSFPFPGNYLSSNVEYVGYSGRGHFNQSGGNNQTGYLYVGLDASAHGIYTLSGSATLNTSISAIIGYAGIGAMTVGVTARHYASGQTHVGYGLGGIGTYNLGPDGLVFSSGDFILGTAGGGTLNQTGGTLTMSDGADLLLGNSAGGGLGVLKLSAGLIRLNSADSHIRVGVGGGGTLTHTGAAIIDSDGSLSVGHAAGSTGHYLLSTTASLSNHFATIGNAGNGSFLHAAGEHRVAFGVAIGQTADATGTYSLSGGALKTQRLDIGYNGTGVFHHTGGSCLLSQALQLAVSNGASGSYALSGTATLTALELLVGGRGNGSFSQTGGNVLLTSTIYPLILAQFPGSSASYHLAGDAVLDVNGSVALGDSGTVDFTQSGGLFFVSNSIVRIALGPSSSANYLLSGGSLFVSQMGSVIVGGLGNATFTQTGGTHTIRGSDGLIISQGTASTYTLSGGELSTPAITTNPNGRFFFNGGSLTVATLRMLGGKVSLNNNAATRVESLSFAGNPGAWQGQLDLHNSALVLQTTSNSDKDARIPTLLSQIASAWAGGPGDPWTGPGITSSTAAADSANFAVALADNAALGYTTFRGQLVDANSLLITPALFGDANLDLAVDAFDLNLLAAHWQQPANALWSDGDFNADGVVNAFDLNLLAAHWQSTSLLSASPLSIQDSGLRTQDSVPPSPIPEPTSLLLLALPSLTLLRRRPR